MKGKVYRMVVRSLLLSATYKKTGCVVGGGRTEDVHIFLSDQDDQK